MGIQHRAGRLLLGVPAMRSFAVALALLVTASIADARPKKPYPREPDVAVRGDEADFDRVRDRKRKKPRERDWAPQSFGLAWNGTLKNGVQLHMGHRVYIRRPQRAWGTHSTVEFTKRAIEETLEQHPKAHELLIGDISQHGGGRVTDHHSHQSGRDIDLGLFYKQKPAGYPNVFLPGTDANLDSATMWTLINKLSSTSNKDGGVWAIFLDYDVQGVIYRWAKTHGVSETKLNKVFQYPHGRGANAGIVRHYRNHAHHLHVRFKCTKAETSCR
jgi:Penicillin-insensitive murein endopeptidase